MSFFTIHDGVSYKTFETAQDHKRVLEGDNGKNTGGMGAYSPSRLINLDLDKKIMEKIIKPTIKGLNEEISKKDKACEKRLRSQRDDDDVECKKRIRKAVNDNKDVNDIVTCEEVKALIKPCKKRGLLK